MGQSANEVHARLDALINASTAAAERADEDAIRLLLGLADHHLDEPTLAFLKQARRCVLGTTSALSAVLDAHRGHTILIMNRPT